MNQNMMRKNQLEVKPEVKPEIQIPILTQELFEKIIVHSNKLETIKVNLKRYIH